MEKTGTAPWEQARGLAWPMLLFVLMWAAYRWGRSEGIAHAENEAIMAGAAWRMPDGKLRHRPW